MSASALGNELPGKEIGIVLGLGQQNFVAGAEMRTPKHAAARLMASVVPRVKTISSGERA